MDNIQVFAGWDEEKQYVSYTIPGSSFDFELNRIMNQDILKAYNLNGFSTFPDLQTEFNFDYVIDKIEPEKTQPCVCDIMSLMAVGCKCGQMERERSME